MTQSKRPFRTLRTFIGLLSTLIAGSLAGAIHRVADLLAIFSEVWVVLLLIAVAAAMWRRLWLYVGIGFVFAIPDTLIGENGSNE